MQTITSAANNGTTIANSVTAWPRSWRSPRLIVSSLVACGARPAESPASPAYVVSRSGVIVSCPPTTARVLQAVRQVGEIGADLADEGRDRPTEHEQHRCEDDDHESERETVLGHALALVVFEVAEPKSEQATREQRNPLVHT